MTVFMRKELPEFYVIPFDGGTYPVTAVISKRLGKFQCDVRCENEKKSFNEIGKMVEYIDNKLTETDSKSASVVVEDDSTKCLNYLTSHGYREKIAYRRRYLNFEAVREYTYAKCKRLLRK